MTIKKSENQTKNTNYIRNRKDRKKKINLLQKRR